jgi:hypothetical protein
VFPGSLAQKKRRVDRWRVRADGAAAVGSQGPPKRAVPSIVFGVWNTDFSSCRGHAGAM